MKNSLHKPKILFVHNYYQIPGGEDTVVANEMNMLLDQGHEVILYSRNNSEIKSMSIFQKLLLPLTTIFSLKTYREVKKIIKQEKIEIVHVHNTLSLISPSVYYAAFSRKVNVVQTVHNFRLICPGALLYREGEICEDCLSNGLKCAVTNSCYRNSKMQTLICVLMLKIHRLLGTYKRINYICLTEFNKRKLLQVNEGNKQIINPEMVFVKPNFSINK
ncbi:glycosyltransferase [Paenibacillus sp. MMO-177]|uniref:glycosyltransferase n=1 Tax=Paenibacillus sp. MMO-177 TaxID=3081289 RepID=UPI0030184D7E